MDIAAKLKSFFTWWWQGLCSAWGAGQPRVRLLELSAAGLTMIDPATMVRQAINIDQTDDLAKLDSTRNFLLAPAETTLNTAIQVSRRDQSVQQIAEALLPFNSNELYLAADQAKQELFAVSRSDVAPLLARLEEYGLTTHGVAFTGKGEVHYASFAAAADSFSLPARARWFAVSLIAAIALAGIYAWLAESRAQSELESRLAELRARTAQTADSAAQAMLTDESVAEVAASLRSISVRNAAQVRALLQILARNMPAGAEIEQLIVTDTEVVLDGNATSATTVQTMLEQTGEFAGSEFISAISTSADQQSERFRLRLVLPNE